ncbi:hypothetical protein Vretimale_5152 [Volvox reticuliferus]|uniref:Uncharacterized protein n=1 Tax=Volvox reticuliferus TaxID=1737510 RepID=A0A8J4C597_9CHLO|nr:hypothetical protein Vretifemale_3767 [Volvox reticuliferus]GIM00370.1 hypothetical protein Vretimale_5152 [Volvox reticuliferus]
MSAVLQLQLHGCSSSIRSRTNMCTTKGHHQVLHQLQCPLVPSCRPARAARGLCVQPVNVAAGLPPASPQPQPPSSPSSNTKNVFVNKLASSSSPSKSSLPAVLAGLGSCALLSAAAIHLNSTGTGHATTLASAAATAIDSLKEFGPADLIAQGFGPTEPLWSVLLQHSHQAAISSAHHHQIIAASAPTTSILSEARDMGEGAAEAVRDAVGGLCDDYNRWLKESPLICKIVTGNFFTIAGDMLAQLGLGGDGGDHGGKAGSTQVAGTNKYFSTSSGGRRKADLMRTGRLCLETSAIGTPLGHWWFSLLDGRIMPDNPHCPTAVLAKMLLDQVIFAPLGLLMFFVVIKCLEGRPQQLPYTLRSSYVKTLLGGYLLWPLAGILNFALLPNEYRLLFNNCVNIIWTCFLSIMSSGGNAGKDTDPEGLPASPESGETPAATAATVVATYYSTLTTAIKMAVLVTAISAGAAGRPNFAYVTGIAAAAVEAVVAAWEQELMPAPVMAAVEPQPPQQQLQHMQSLPFAAGAFVSVGGPCLEVCQEPVDALYEMR